MNTQNLKAGDTVMIGAAAMIKLAIGWTAGDGTGHEGYNVADYFRADTYLGPDEHGIEPIFRDLTPGEALDYSAPDWKAIASENARLVQEARSEINRLQATLDRLTDAAAVVQIAAKGLKLDAALAATLSKLYEAMEATRPEVKPMTAEHHNRFPAGRWGNRNETTKG